MNRKKDKNPELALEEITLSKEEASNLAEEMKLKLQMSSKPEIGTEFIPLMIAGLGDDRGLIRRTFVEILGVIGSPAVPSLRKALVYHSNVTVRRAAAKALRLTGDPNALPDLLKALMNDKDPVVQGSSVGAMAVFGESAVKHLLKVLSNPRSTEMQCGLASWGLSFIGAEAPNAIREAAQSKNSKIKAAAIAALGEQIQSYEDEIAKDLVLNALDDPNISVRVEATTLLGKLNQAKWTNTFLIRKLTDSSPNVKKRAALSLMKLNASEAIKDLQRVYKVEKDLDVANIFKLAIDQLIG